MRTNISVFINEISKQKSEIYSQLTNTPIIVKHFCFSLSNIKYGRKIIDFGEKKDNKKRILRQ